MINNIHVQLISLEKSKDLPVFIRALLGKKRGGHISLFSHKKLRGDNNIDKFKFGNETQIGHSNGR